MLERKWESAAHYVSHDIGVVALAEHADLLLYVCNLVTLPMVDDFDSHKLASRLHQGFVHRAVRAPTWRMLLSVS